MAITPLRSTAPGANRFGILATFAAIPRFSITMDGFGFSY
jgi:hypothetical protein